MPRDADRDVVAVSTLASAEEKRCEARRAALVAALLRFVKRGTESNRRDSIARVAARVDIGAHLRACEAEQQSSCEE